MRAAIGSGSCTAARIRPPPARCSAISSPNRGALGARRAAPAARRAARARAGWRSAAPAPAAAAGRPRAGAPARSEQRRQAQRVAPAARAEPPSPPVQRAWKTQLVARRVRPVFSPSWWPSRWTSRARASSGSSAPAAPSKAIAPGQRPDEAGDGAQQAGLAGAVRPGQRHRLAGRRASGRSPSSSTPLAALQRQAATSSAVIMPLDHRRPRRRMDEPRPRGL